MERFRRWRDDRYLWRLRDRRVKRALLTETDPQEDRIAPRPHSPAQSTVASHWVVYVPRLLEALVGLLIASAVLAKPDGTWQMLIIPAALVLHAAYSSFVVFMDVMVLTNIRVFRIEGAPVNKRASMPLSRILDITVRRPLLGAILGYGHFTFESAAQTQGMKDVKFVPHPFAYEKMILEYVHISSDKSGPPREGTRSR